MTSSTSTRTECGSEEYLNYRWPDTPLGTSAAVPCPCDEILGVVTGEVIRQCLETPQGAAMWSTEIHSRNCESQVSQQLCYIALVTSYILYIPQGTQAMCYIGLEESSLHKQITF